MTIEEQLKALILSKYKSVNAFAEAVDVPYTTVTSMLNRDMMKTGIGSVIKICKLLGISADGLGDGKIVAREQLELTPTEIELIKTYRQLDERGKITVEETVKREFSFVKPFEEDSPIANSTG